MVVMVAPRSIVCWSCGKDVSLEGEPEVCPHCGALLDEQSFDARAGELLRAVSDADASIGDAETQLTEERSRCARWGLLGKLPIFPARRRAKRIEDRLVALRAERKATIKTLRACAVARYYISKWYRVTGITLNDNRRPEVVFARPRYSLEKDGAVAFSCRAPGKTKEQRRLIDAHYAEYEVFCAIQAMIDEGKLGHSRLLANLVATYDEDERQRYRRRVRANEIDMLLVTESALVVIEVKCTWKALTIAFDDRRGRHRIARIGVNKSGELFGTEQEDGAASQVSAHCRTIENSGVYSTDLGSVVGLVVYVGSPRIDMRCEQGLGSVPVFFAEHGGVSAPDRSLEMGQMLAEAVRCVPPLRSPAEVDAVADELFARYADLDGSKTREHRERLKRERLVRGADDSSRRTRRTRSTGSRRQDQELERMLSQVRCDGSSRRHR